MDWLDIAIPAAIIAPFVLIVGLLIMRSVRRAQLIRHGDFSIAKVVSISQTGTTVNQVPEMRLAHQPGEGGAHRQDRGRGSARYDPADRQTVSIDSVAMGYGDPYAAVIKALSPG
jgi:hypothetical protein